MNVEISVGKMPSKEPMVTITQKEYDSLLERSEWLSWLEAAGVDNWSGYEFAQEMRDEED